MNAFIAWFMATIGKYISAQLSVFLVSMLPLIELRGGIIVARLLNLPMWEAIFYCVLGNVLPIPFILFFIKKFLHWMAKHNMKGLANALIKKAEKNKPKIEKYGFWGLTLFVGIPLPGTGAWTGSLVASVFDMDLKKASLSILIGVFLACTIMCLISYGVFHF